MSFGLCECGCGEPAPIAIRTDRRAGAVKGKPRRFINGHNTRKSPVEFIVDSETGCWEWQKAKTPNGYGQKVPPDSRRSVLAHRYYYELLVGPIPDGLEIDHLCRNRGCVNPGHMEPVTRRENSLRGDGPALVSARARAVTHCPRGHEYDEANTYFGAHGRSCRACHREWERQRRNAANLRAEATMSEGL